MQVLVISNTIHGKINTSINNLLGAAKALGSQCDVLVAGYNLDSISKQIAAFARVNQVFTLDNPGLNNILVENIAPQLSEIIQDYSHVLVAADSFGKNLLPRIAGILEIGQISEIIAVQSSNVFKKFIYAGNVLIEVESLENIKLLSVQANNFTPDLELATNPAVIKPLDYTGTISNAIKFITENVIDKSVDLASAKIVVSGGISLGSKDAFDSHIRPLAGKLNAAVGATRAAVEAGYAENDTQVGQTGTKVAPQLYLAIGISGAVQHIAGMKDSKTVIAINSDSTAPIFEHADYGMVGDLFTLVPQLITKL